jgi:endonuclease YncB( thermonuclease family)
MNYSKVPRRLVLAFLSCLLGTPGFAQELTAFTGQVKAVSDGDRITVVDNKKNEHKIRLAGIDAPEPGQEFGAAARDYLSGLVLNQPVTVVGKRSDRDGRLIAQVFMLGRDVSYSLLWAGLAWHDESLDDDQPKDDRKRYAEAEKFARGTKVNLWSQPKPVPPWEYRKNHPAENPSQQTAAAAAELEKKTGSTAEKPAATITVTPVLEIVGNKESKIYHWNPGCPGFSKIAEKNRVPFSSKGEAEAAGYRAAKNCKNP